MNYYKKILFVVILLSVQFHAQNKDWANFTAVEKVFGIVCSQNNVWIGTNGGLIRLDRTTEILSYFNKANANLPGNEIRSIAMDSTGNLWIGTQFDGVGRFDGRTCKVYNQLNSRLPNDQVNTSINVDPEGNIWIGSFSTLVKVDKDSLLDQYWKFYRVEYPHSPYPAIFAIEFDNNGVCWVGADWGLNKFLNDKLTIEQGSAYTSINSIAFDKNNFLWLGSQGNGLYNYDGTNWVNYNTSNSDLPSNDVFDLTFDKEGNLWIATTLGLVKYNGSEWKVFNTTNSGLPSNFILSFCIDDENTIWLGHYASYLSKFNITEEKLIKSFNLSNNTIPAYSRIENIVEDRYSNKWFGGDSRLHKFDGKVWSYYDKNNFELLNSTIAKVYSDTSQIIWKGDGIIVLFKNNKWNVSDINNKHKGNVINEDSFGDIWYVDDKGLYNYNGKIWITFNTTNSPLSGNNITKMAFADNGNIFLCVSKGFGISELMKFDGNNWESYKVFDDNIFDIEVDSEGNIWLATGELLKFDGAVWNSYDVQSSLSMNNSVYSLAIDKMDNLWVGTATGVAKFYKSSQLQFYDRFNSGLSGEQIYSAAIDNSDNKWFCSNKSGVSAFNEGGVILTEIKNILFKSLPSEYKLLQNYPNPFNAGTTIRFSIPVAASVTLKIYNTIGQEISTLVSGEINAGNYSINWIASNIATGVYYYRLRSGTYSETRKLIILK